MKQYNSIQTIATLLVAAVMILAGCSKENLANTPVPPPGMGQLTLGSLRLSECDDVAQTRAVTTSKLPLGSTLRLYIFDPGVTDFNKLIATRTYTVNADGVPVLDDEQQTLFLPSGMVDVYLVGPVVHTTATGGNHVVASEQGIFPVVGADLIAAHASAEIKIGNANVLPDITLTHKMSKVQVQIKPIGSPNFSDLKVSQVKIYGQPLGGSYTLDNTGGVVTPNEQVGEFTFPAVVEESPGQTYTATTMLMPQSEKSVKVEASFTCKQNSPANAPTLPYRHDGTLSVAFAANTATRISSSIITTNLIRWRVLLMPWNEVIQNEIEIPSDLARAQPLYAPQNRTPFN